MDLATKLEILADAAKYDASCASSGTNKRNSRDGGLGSTTGAGICHSYTPDGRCVSLLKILLTNFCTYDCQYCINRVSSDVRRARFTTDEVVGLTLDFYRRNYIEGLFLSSGIIRSADYTMEQVVKVARTLREVHQFRGYIHLKTIPEAAPELIAEAGRWADRISINVELPTQSDLEKLAPEKNLGRIRATMGVIEERISAAKTEQAKSRFAPPFAPAGQSTQIIVGATPTPDRSILEQASSLYGEHRLRRVYYSAFSPIPDASKSLPIIAPPLIREHRLYQADWLLRFYGFHVEELTTAEAPDLSLEMDPKLAWALRNPGLFPVDLHTAPRELMLRIPGLGVRNVDRLIQARRWHRVRLADLMRLRVPLKKVMPFIITADHRPVLVGNRARQTALHPGQQMEFFGAQSLPKEGAGLLSSSDSLPLRRITFTPTFAGWRQAARLALQENRAPEDILWEEEGSAQQLLDIGVDAEVVAEAEPKPEFEAEAQASANAESASEAASPSSHSSDISDSRARVPKEFIEVATRVACHCDSDRWSLLYRVLWRITHGEHHLMAIAVDPDVHRLRQMEKAIRHDVHKMRAFVRFRAVEHAGATWYVAWFEPEHHIVELNASFFVDRFAGMCWSILTPDRCAHWDGTDLTFTGGVTRRHAPADDVMESLWITYYSHIFNPARVKTHAMQAEMPQKYWKNLPEAAAIPVLLSAAPARVELMMEKSMAKKTDSNDVEAAVIPDTESLEVLHEAAAKCMACPLYKNATHVVFGEGSPKSRIVLLGEQPGDSEDLAGHPFVGPAGKLLNRALAEAGVDREQAYVTNSVKHFKWERSGKRRLHKKPSEREVAACRPWLEAEMRTIAPQILVCLGATAAQNVLGREVRVLRDRGQFFISEFAPHTFITVHPSSLLRAPDEESRAQAYAEFVSDLRLVAQQLSVAQAPDQR